MKLPLGSRSSALRVFARRIWFSVVFVVASAMAQDVTVGEPVWFAPSLAPDELPGLKSRPRVSYPREMKETSELGYVVTTRYVDRDGQVRALSIQSTHTPFERSVEESFSGWSFRPARDGGEAVDGVAWVPVIFNPKSAAAEGPDATPRLLQVTPVITPHRPLESEQPQVVQVRIGLDETGAVVAADPVGTVNPTAAPAVIAAVQRWKFAPARRAGRAVAAEIVLSAICQPPLDPKMVDARPPRLTKPVTPNYPIAMRRFGFEGTVTLDYVVTREGAVANPRVVSSTNPAFDEPALEAVSRWAFQPGTMSGRPVATRARQTITFNLEGGSTREVFSFKLVRDQSKLPPELRHDTVPKIQNVQIPVYPVDLRRDRVRGKAAVAVVLDRQGEVQAVRVLEATRPEFGLALVAAMEGFRFDPALLAGRPVPFLFRFEQEFDDDALPDEQADEFLRREKKQPSRILANASTLDRPLKPVSRRAPIFPPSVGPEAEAGDATIDFIVDEQGRVRLPRVTNASAPAFGYAAIQALSAWWFEPPRAGGKPVAVRVRAPFRFTRAAEPKDATDSSDQELLK